MAAHMYVPGGSGNNNGSTNTNSRRSLTYLLQLEEDTVKVTNESVTMCFRENVLCF